MTFTDVLTGVGPNRDALEAMTSPTRARVEGIWDEATNVALDYIRLIRTNNRGAEWSQILGRYDVQQVLQTPFVQAADASEDVIRAGWAATVQLAQTHTSEQLNSMGVTDVIVATPSDEPIERVVADLRRNALEASDRISGAIIANDSINGARPIGADLSRRAGFSTDYALRRGYHDAQQATYVASGAAGASLRKVWVTRFGPGTCGACARLHGVVLDLDGTFPLTSAFGTAPGVYEDLTLPPRHPNCRCYLTPYVEGSADGGVSPTTMREYALAWTKSVLKALAKAQP